MIVDGHNHLGDVPALGWHQSPEELLEEMNRNHVDRAVVCPQTYPQSTVLSVNQQDNDFIAGCMKAHPDRFVGFGVSTPYSGPNKGAVEAERALTELGLGGIKLHQRYHAYHLRPDMIGSILEVCAAAGAPVLIHSGDVRSHPSLVGNLAQAFPKVTVIMAHMGQNYYPDAIEAAKLAPNLILETSGAGPEAVKSAVQAIGSSRVVYGTDTPFLPISVAQRAIREAGLSEADSRAVLGDSLARLLGLLH